MSFLYPLFLLGAIGIAVPVYLHLRRQAARRELPFSSLRFLKPSPPRVDSRRRIERWPLLALRALALGALALAFSRPFVPQPAGAMAARDGTRSAVLLDTSASMRRGDLWEQARQRVRARIPRSPEDGFALLTFADRATTILSFEDWSRTAPAERAALVERRLSALEPGFGATDLGAGLLAAAESLLDARAEDDGPLPETEEVVLVSDLQEGSRLGALRSSEWPADVVVALEPLAPPPGPNLAAHVASFAEEAVAQDPALGQPGTLVRVLAHGEGALDVFLGWADDRAKSPPFPLPGGQSRVVRAPGPVGATGILQVEGDNHAFDNRLAVAPPLARHLRVLYIGDDAGAGSGKTAAARAGATPGGGAGTTAGDPEMPLYFLERAFSPTMTTRPTVTARTPQTVRAADVNESHLVVATASPPRALVPDLRRHMERGRTLVYAPVAPKDDSGLGLLLETPGARLVADETPGEHVLTEIDREHPFLAPFAQGPFSDFAKIRFWNRRRVEPWPLPEARALATFDDGSPAWIARPVGRGVLLILTAGWQPKDSQLALSSRFVPLVWNLLEHSAGFESGRTQFVVGEPVPIAAPSNGTAKNRFVRQPDGTRVRIPADATLFRQTSQPGLYVLEGGDRPQPFAVNLAPSESVTPPLPLEQIEAHGVRLAEEDTQPVAAAARSPRLATDGRGAEAALVEMESRQRHWRWALLGVFAFLLLETFLGRRQAPPLDDPAAAKGTT